MIPRWAQFVSAGALMRASAFFIALGMILCPVQSSGADRRGFSQPSAVRRVGSGLLVGPAPRSREEMLHLKLAGVHRIVDLRTLRVLPGIIESRRARSLGMHYIRVPIGLRPMDRGRLPELLHLIEGASASPTYVHCQLGRDRTGLATALFRTEMQSVAPEVAYREFRQHRFNQHLRGLDEAFWAIASGPRPLGR